MDIEQLRYFLAVSRYRNMTLAAEHLYISQSSLSKHIVQLEEEVGLKLFDRNERTLRLNSAGHEFFSFAEELVAKHGVMMRKMQQYRQPDEGHLTLGSIPIMSQYDIHRAIAAFAKQYPDITIQTFEEKGDHIVKMLDEELLDLAVVRTVTLPSNAYKVIPLADDELVFVTNTNHPLAHKKPLPLREAAEESFILLDSGPGLYDLCLSACAKAGFSPTIRYQHTRIESIIGFVAENIGVSLLMKKVISFFQHPDIVWLELEEPATSTLALVFPHGKKLSPSANLFRNFLIKWFKK
ncbi:transcription regulator hth lysr [Lucifera butyrica]|uniref:Transcription regulator hth lysr n=1 Tax=Lucifera butyrica TaxID=1351585 RepID=A0A498RKE6_9FIRM|nr:LysR family transcriptional regulator [Lucifera butyrica]VBB09518.1 transcription regulator hth lysr [Lucifera butyrica]